MSVAFYPQMGVVLFGSEAAATKVAMGSSIDMGSHASTADMMSLLAENAIPPPKRKEAALGASLGASFRRPAAAAFAKANAAPTTPEPRSASPASRDAFHSGRKFERQVTRVQRKGGGGGRGGGSGGSGGGGGGGARAQGGRSATLNTSSYRIDLDDVNGEVVLLSFDLAPEDAHEDLDGGSFS